MKGRSNHGGHVMPHDVHADCVPVSKIKSCHLRCRSVKDLARLSLKDPMYISVHEHAQHSTPTQLQQSYIVCQLHEKMDLLWSFIKNHVKSKILVFIQSCKQVNVQTKERERELVKLFPKFSPGTCIFHVPRDQSAVEQNLCGFLPEHSRK